MSTVEILVDLPLKNTASVYTYAVPEQLADEAEYGKRVLIELGSRNVEGFIISEPSGQEIDLSVKAILQVLDVDPVFSRKLYRLAEWMADTYICPISTALRSMIPPALSRKKGKWIVPLVSQEEMESTIHELSIGPPLKIIEELSEGKPIRFSDAVNLADRPTLQAMIDHGLIEVIGKYTPTRPDKNGVMYQAVRRDPDIDIDRLEKTAPRQAHLLKAILARGELEQTAVDKDYPSSTIKALLHKGYITTSRKANVELPVYHDLLDEQKRVVEEISRGISCGEYKEFLLHGVTASGKTEVYLQAIHSCLETGRSAIVLVPEIALTRHLMGNFISRFPNTTVLHSSMRSSERYESWKRINNGEVSLVLGTRSAVFAPLNNIGLMIIDEEHENTYKQEENPKYQACEVARRRAEEDQAIIVYGSATPSLDTYYRAMQGEIELLQLNRRIGNLGSPIVHIHDIRKANRNNKAVSEFMAEKIRTALNNNGQCILFLNRRGYAPISICRSCGQVLTCPACSVSLNYHQDLQMNLCHYCNYQEKISSSCKGCGSNYLDLTGFGTQKVEAEIRDMFPDARIARLDVDSSRNAGNQEKILASMKNNEIDILVGTQMVAKGLDFPGVSLVGIISADAMLNMPDYRAGERAFQLMVQAAGRAGRGDIPGEVVIQTYNPDHPVIRWAVDSDYNAFYNAEIHNRFLLNYPPFTNIMRIVLSGLNEEQLIQAADILIQQINDYIDAREDAIDILGPAPCPIYKLRKRYRQQLILKCDNMLLLKSIGERILDKGTTKGQRLGIEINPLNMI
ncbi:helicase pria essential for oric/dnaa-independent dna replication [hydrocarbon metagenome]|uniref:DNA 3'-5' helicase n=1 Tax=hydrocarbon metagenome TaxID=938273 RepID=A0A0W8E538_9ZZZZ